MSTLHNCHTHIFNIKNAPEYFLQGFVKKVIANVAWPILNTQLGAFLLIRGIKILARDPHTKKLASFLKVGTMKNQNQIFNDLKSNYQPDDKFVVLTLNMDHMGAGKAEHSFNQQIHEIKRVKRLNLEACLPFYSVDPRAGTANELQEQVHRAISGKGFNGIKIYPALGFYPFHPNMENVYKWAAESQVPIMTHTTRVGSYYLGKITNDMVNPDSFYKEEPKNWPEKFGKIQFPITKHLNDNERFCDYFSEIYNYAKVMSRFENLKICFAHAGGVDEITNDPAGIKWFEQIKHLMRTYPNVYTDISYTLYKKKVFPYLLKLIVDDEIGDKVLFGTDFFMTLKENSERKLVDNFRNYLKKEAPNSDLWKKITVDNPKVYLSSGFYKA